MNYNPLLSSLVEIFDGYTKFEINGQPLFLRHFCLRDQKSIEDFYLKYKNIALKKGLETQKQIEERLVADNLWLPEDDLKVSELETYISNLRKTKDKILLPSQKEIHQNLIDAEVNKLNELLAKKNELVSVSAEKYAENRSNEEFLRILIYDHKNLSELKFTEENFSDLNTEELSNITEKYFQISQKFSDDEIQKIVLQDFFNIYMSCCEDPQAFFGKFIHQLSAYQMKLLLYGRIFYNIFQYNDDIPDDIKKDPKAIFDFVDSKKSRESYQSKVKDNSATMLFGATPKDVEILDPLAKKVSLSEQIEKNGGHLSMEQMMGMLNQ